MSTDEARISPTDAQWELVPFDFLQLTKLAEDLTRLYYEVSEADSYEAVLVAFASYVRMYNPDDPLFTSNAVTALKWAEVFAKEWGAFEVNYPDVTDQLTSAVLLLQQSFARSGGDLSCPVLRSAVTELEALEMGYLPIGRVD